MMKWSLHVNKLSKCHHYHHHYYNQHSEHWWLMNICWTKCCIHLLVLFTFCIYSHTDGKLHKSVMYDCIIFCLEEVCNMWKLLHLKSRIWYKTLFVIYIAQTNVLHKTLNQLPITPVPCAWFSWFIIFILSFMWIDHIKTAHIISNVRNK